MYQSYLARLMPSISISSAARDSARTPAVSRMIQGTPFRSMRTSTISLVTQRYEQGYRVNGCTYITERERHYMGRANSLANRDIPGSACDRRHDTSRALRQ